MVINIKNLPIISNKSHVLQYFKDKIHIYTYIQGYNLPIKDDTVKTTPNSKKCIRLSDGLQND